MDRAWDPSASSSNLQTCRRCFCQEAIPTHQTVKFDTQMYFLCRKCWEDFRRWFHWGRRTASAGCAVED